MGQLRALVDLPATEQAPGTARTVVGALASAWGLADLVDDARLVVSELVTNAVQHAPGPESFELELVRRAEGLRISLADGSAVRPLVHELDPARPSGRGLAIVQVLSSGWGAEDHHGGKRVWADLDWPAPPG